MITLRRGSTLLLVLLLASTTSASAQLVTNDSQRTFQIVPAPFDDLDEDDFSVDISGDACIVVAKAADELFLTDSGSRFRIPYPNPTGQTINVYTPRFNGRYAVWSRDYDSYNSSTGTYDNYRSVEWYDTKTGVSQPLSSNRSTTQEETNPDVSDVAAVWMVEGVGGTTTVNVREWATGITRALDLNGANGYYPRIDGSVIALVTRVDLSAGDYVYNVYKHDLRGGGGFQKLNTVPANDIPRVAIHGGRVVWSADGDIYLHDGTQTLRISNDSAPDAFPSIYGKLIVWSRKPPGEPRYSLFYRDLTNGVTRRLTSTFYDCVAPSVDRRGIVFHAGFRPMWIREVRPYAPAWYSSPFYTYQFAYYARDFSPGGYWANAAHTGAYNAYTSAIAADAEFSAYGSTQNYYSKQKDHQYWAYNTFYWTYYAYVEKPNAYAGAACCWALADLLSVNQDLARK